MLGFKTTREVAAELGVLETRIENAIRRREIARPPVHGHARLWSPEAIETVRAIFAARDARRAARTRRTKAAHAPLIDPVDLAVDLCAELDREHDEAVRS